MAIRLQREHSLPVVAARLVQGADGPAVQLDLVVNEDGQPSIEGSQTLSLQEYVGRAGSSHELQLAVPASMVQFVSSWANDVMDPDRTLWLHLLKPYGVLGAVPWERDLVPVLQRPVLRLPDVLPSPSRSTTRFTVAVVATAPEPEGPPPGLTLGIPVASALDKAFPGGMRLHVFADAAARSTLEDELRARGHADVEVHAPDGRAVRRSQGGRVDQLRNGWLRWVRDALAGRPVDIVHFLVHGNSLGTRGAILTPLEATEAREVPVSVEASEIDVFLTQVGALIAGFTRLPDNWSDHGLRQVTDELGAHRAGPVLLHDPQEDQELAALEQSYRFLTHDGPSVPPVSPSLALYAQPRQVIQEGEALPEADSWSIQPSSAVQAQFEKDDTPGWLAVAQRYLEQQELALMRFRTESQSRTPSPAEVSHYAGVESGLRKARGVIDQHAERLL
jgi:hypothetical protein